MSNHGPAFLALKFMTRWHVEPPHTLRWQEQVLCTRDRVGIDSGELMDTERERERQRERERERERERASERARGGRDSASIQLGPNPLPVKDP